jgi:hypothetical protein
LLSKGPAIFVATLAASRNYILLLLLMTASSLAVSQELPVMRNPSRSRNLMQGAPTGLSRMGAITTGASSNSMKRRDKLEDFITISYRLLNQPLNYLLDSSVSDFTVRFPLKATTLHLGNLGGATRPLLFSPQWQPGFDAGFHAYDPYRLNPSEVPFFQTTRPYTELEYSLGTRVEQIIGLQHTQNINAGWNFFFRYRMINSPGIFQHQRSNHSNFVFTTRYQSKNLRYQSWALWLFNKLQSEENGGIVDTTDILNDPIFVDRFNIPAWLGGPDNFTSNFFSTRIKTGNQYNNRVFLWRNQYDLGREDSLVTDSTVVPLFFPRVRLEHQFRYDKEQYAFIDKVPVRNYYNRFYQIPIGFGDTVDLRDQWQLLTNDFSIYQFPDQKNLKQYFKAGASLQLVWGTTALQTRSFLNWSGNFSYRNITLNKKWDLALDGVLYFAGLHAGDYMAEVRLQRRVGSKKNTIEINAINSNRRPSFVFDPRSSFYLSKRLVDLKKENRTQLGVTLDFPALGTELTGNYSLLTNYTYITNYFEPQQESSLFTVLQLSLLKTFRVAKRWRWHTEVYWQQRVGAAQVNTIPFYLRNRFAYEGSLGFTNLNLATGIEVRYRPLYKADAYSPLLGQFFYQDSVTIQNPLPDIACYVNFKIRSFTAFIRAENLNTARDLQGFGFTRNNVVVNGYALNGLHIRVGIHWQFVN